MTLRLFVAIPVPEEIGLRLVPLQRDLNGASWRLPENFHLTLRFFGEIDEAKAKLRVLRLTCLHLGLRKTAAVA